MVTLRAAAGILRRKPLVILGPVPSGPQTAGGLFPLRLRDSPSAMKVAAPRLLHAPVAHTRPARHFWSGPPRPSWTRPLPAPPAASRSSLGKRIPGPSQAPPPRAAKPARLEDEVVDLSSGAPADDGPWASVDQWVVRTRPQSHMPPSANALPAPRHATVARVPQVFSDLHVSKRTLQTCLEVLARVGREARERNAGVLFLGDLWHERGSLPVEPLNAVLEAVAEWEMPSLWLVGNHDQATASGTEHALRALDLSSPRVHVFSRPALFLGSLFMPYRKDGAELERVVSRVLGAGGGQGVKAIFAHLDVLGASYNETHQARGGVRPSLFPDGVPVFTGHYHLPHTVPGTNITYVGSPYQVTRAEAGQEKRLLLLDRDFRPAGDVGLDVGPRHFAVRTSAPEGSYLSRKEGAELQALVRELESGGLRGGDRVWVELREPPGKEERKEVARLARRGVSVQVVVSPAQLRPRIRAAEELSPQQLLGEYARQAGLPDDAVRAAQEILEEEAVRSSLGHCPPVRLELASVTMEGFGPFRAETSYEFRGAGLRMICGDNRDDLQSDSNGAGKSSLASATLWCLTGQLDPSDSVTRDLQRAEVVHDGATEAAVEVRGTVNGQDFIVRRTSKARRPRDGPEGVRQSAGSSLTLALSGLDETLGTMPATQGRIDEVFGTEYLPGAVFMTHRSVHRLLEATDREFRDALSPVVQLSAWEAAREVARGRMGRAREEALGKEVVLERCRAELGRARERRAQAERDRDAWAAEEEERRERASSEALGILDLMVGPAVHAAETLRLARSRLAAAEDGIRVAGGALGSDAAGGGRGGGGGGGGRAGGGGGGGGGEPGGEESAWAAKEAALLDKARLLRRMEVMTGDRERSAREGLLQARSTVGEARGVARLTEKGVIDYARVGKGLPGAEQAVLEFGSEGLAEELGLGCGHDDEHAGGRAVCDRCRQEIDAGAFVRRLTGMVREALHVRARLAELEREEAEWERELAAAEEERAGILADAAACEEELEGVRSEREEARRRREDERSARRRAEEQARVKLDEAKELAAAARGAVSSANDARRALCDIAGEWAATSGPAGDQLAALAAELLEGFEAAGEGEEEEGAGEPGAGALGGEGEAPADGAWTDDEAWMEDCAWRGACERSEALAAEAEAAGDMASNALAELRWAIGECEVAAGIIVDRALAPGEGGAANPHAPVVATWAEEVSQREAECEEVAAAAERARRSAETLALAEAAFGRRGVQAFLLEGAVAELQEAAQGYLSKLSTRLSLRMSTVSERKAGPKRARGRAGNGKPDASDGETTDGEAAGGDVGATTPGPTGGNTVERVEKVLEFRAPGSGEVTRRSPAQLSGGERMRVSLSLALGLMDVLERRGRLQCNVLVLDEVIQRMDSEGVSVALSVLRGLEKGVLLVGQPGHFEQRVEAVDWVVKEGGASRIVRGAE